MSLDPQGACQSVTAAALPERSAIGGASMLAGAAPPLFNAVAAVDSSLPEHAGAFAAVHHALQSNDKDVSPAG
ncbi:hypothetical protein FHR56_002429 [Xanthomonas sacchari]|uniref:hypothetical protein n=1 Tax=unclassified Xanthomonas TaxID=2643310 RepID=UPI0013684FCF|nr:MULTISPECIES: hypothetical protein [unclassified Xanthomonas]MBB6367264.1 hypothetical protein [Xanthomonas sp. F10]